jgi:hypothetical protein
MFNIIDVHSFSYIWSKLESLTLTKNYMQHSSIYEIGSTCVLDLVDLSSQLFVQT